MSDDTNIHEHAILFDQPGYGLTDPGDAALAKEIMAENPLSFPSPIKVKGPEKMNGEFRQAITAFSPETRKEIEAQLVGFSGDRREAELDRLMQAAAEAGARKGRVLMGFGSGASELVREQADLSFEVRELVMEHDRTLAALQEVVRHDTVTDPVTGMLLPPVPVYAITGDRRLGYERRMAEVLSRIDALEGAEGKGRQRAAIVREIEARRVRAAEIAEHAEARLRGKDIARETRISARAEAFARQEAQSL